MLETVAQELKEHKRCRTFAETSISVINFEEEKRVIEISAIG